MSVIVECQVEADSFPLGRAVAVPTELTVVVDRIVPTDRGPLPYLWVEGPSAVVEAYIDELRASPSILELTIVDEFRRRRLCRIVWDPDEPSLVGHLTSSDVALLDLRGTENGWRFRIRATNPEIRELHDYCRDLGIRFEIQRVYRAFDRERETFGLTDAQQETLELAVERGYYDEPRRITLEALATEFGVSARAVSRRLRRGTKRLVDNTLLNE